MFGCCWMSGVGEVSSCAVVPACAGMTGRGRGMAEVEWVIGGSVGDVWASLEVGLGWGKFRRAWWFLPAQE